MPSFVINGRDVSQGKAYIIAELSANHQQSLSRALELVSLAKRHGADAVKLQTYTPDTMTLDSDRPEFMIDALPPWNGRKLYDLYAEAMTPWEWHEALFARAREEGLDCFSSPFDPSAVDFLEQFDPPAYKVASFEVTDLPLIEHIARQGRPVIMSTGMANLAEISTAVETVKRAGAPLALLKCTSAYPSPPESMHLRTIPHLAEAFQVVAGLSDHSMGTAVPVAAVALGARIIEKHFTLSRAEPGPDSSFSLEPHEFQQMVDAVRVAEQAVGDVSYALSEKEQASRLYRRSLFVTKPVRKGEKLTPENVRSIRPGHGLQPEHLQRVLDSVAAEDLEPGTPLDWRLLTQ